jgi:hypothetical protein
LPELQRQLKMALRTAVKKSIEASPPLKVNFTGKKRRRFATGAGRSAHIPAETARASPGGPYSLVKEHSARVNLLPAWPSPVGR